MHPSIKALCYEYQIMFDEERLVSAIWSQAVETTRGMVAAVVPKVLCESLGVSLRKLKTIRQRIKVPWLKIVVQPQRGWVVTFDRNAINDHFKPDTYPTNNRRQADNQSSDHRQGIPHTLNEHLGGFLDAVGIEPSAVERIISALISIGMATATRVCACATLAPASSSASADDHITPLVEQKAAQQPTAKHKNQTTVPDDAAADQNPNVQMTTGACEDVAHLHSVFARYGFNVSSSVCEGLVKPSQKPFGDDLERWREFVEHKVSRFVGTSYPLHVMWNALREDGRQWLQDAHIAQREEAKWEELQRRGKSLQQQPKTEKADYVDPFQDIPYHWGLREEYR